MSQIIANSCTNTSNMLENPEDSNDDLVNQADISDRGIMSVLRQHFVADKIYSSIGPIVIALNPYKTLEKLYGQETIDNYKERFELLCTLSESEILSMPQAPHIYRLAGEAYLQLVIHKKRQAIVISGESGAGKTETAKKCLRFISTLCGPSRQSYSGMSSMSKVFSSMSTAGNQIDVPIEDKVQLTNPLLESFGNAKTMRNDNSSRFGKWLEIVFEPAHQNKNQRRKSSSGHQIASLRLSGATITQYLLEKSRVCTQSIGERNYHIFYQLTSVGTSGLSAIFSSDTLLTLPTAEYFRYLSQSCCTSIYNVVDAQEFSKTIDAFKRLSFEADDIRAIFNALIAILYLGNIDFVSSVDGNYAVVDRSVGIVLPSESAAEWLHVSHDLLCSCLVSRRITVRGEEVEINLTPSQATDTRNALAKELYGRVFAHIVQYSNKSLAPSLAAAAPENDLVIGLLDIFGFELFDVNSFEQLCINYANEKLQQYFIRFVINKELEMYEAEAIPIPPSLHNCLDDENDIVLSMMEAKAVGLFARLDEEVKLPKGSDESFLNKLNQEYLPQGSQSTSQKQVNYSSATSTNRFSLCFARDVKMASNQFEIKHFAGTVRYDSTGFVEKNRDKLYHHLEDMVATTSDSALMKIMKDQSPDTAVATVYSNASANLLPSVGPKVGIAANRRRSVTASALSVQNDLSQVTLSSRFQSQLNKLVTILSNSEAHFIRCIKPNSQKMAYDDSCHIDEAFDSDLVLQQLRYSGVIQAIRVRKFGFPVKRSFADFRQDFWQLSRYSKHQLDVLNQEYLSKDRPNDSKTKRNRASFRLSINAQTILSEYKACSAIVSDLQLRSTVYKEQLVIGRSQVFMKHEALAMLNDEMATKYNCAIHILQKMGRGYLSRKRSMRLFSMRTLIRVLNLEVDSFLQGVPLHPQTHSQLLSVDYDGGPLRSLTSQLLETMENAVYNLGLDCVEVAKAIERLDKLSDLLDLQELMREVLKIGESEGYGDRVEMYKSVVEELLTEAKISDANAFCLPELAVLGHQLEGFQVQAAAMEALQLAIDQSDDAVLSSAIDRARSIADRARFKYKSDLLLKAEDKLASLKSEIAQGDSVIASITGLAQKYNGLVISQLDMYGEEWGIHCQLERLDHVVESMSSLPAWHTEAEQLSGPLLSSKYDKDLSSSVLVACKECTQTIENVVNGAGIVATGISKAGGGRRRSMLSPRAADTKSAAPQFSNYQLKWIPNLFNCFRLIHQCLVDLMAEDWVKLEPMLQRIRESITSSTTADESDPQSMSLQFARLSSAFDEMTIFIYQEMFRRRYVSDILHHLRLHCDDNANLIDAEATQYELNRIADSTCYHYSKDLRVLVHCARCFLSIKSSKNDIWSVLSLSEPHEMTIARADTLRKIAAKARIDIELFLNEQVLNETLSSVDNNACICGGFLRDALHWIVGEIYCLRRDAIISLCSKLVVRILKEYQTLKGVSTPNQSQLEWDLHRALEAITIEVRSIFACNGVGAVVDVATSSLLNCADVLLQQQRMFSLGQFEELLGADWSSPLMDAVELYSAITAIKTHSDRASYDNDLLVSYEILLRSFVDVQYKAFYTLQIQSLLNTLNMPIAGSNITGSIGQLIVSDSCRDSVIVIEKGIQEATNSHKQIELSEIIKLISMELNCEVSLSDSQRFWVDKLFNSLLRVCKGVAALRKAFIAFRQQSDQINADQSVDQEDRPESQTMFDSFGSNPFYVRSIADISSIIEGDSLLDREVIVDEFDVNELLRLSFYDRTHLRLVEEVRDSIRDFEDAADNLQEADESVEGSDSSCAKSALPMAIANESGGIPKHIIREVSLCENEILFYTSLKLMIKGIFQCSVDIEPGQDDAKPIAREQADSDEKPSSLHLCSDAAALRYYSIEDSLDSQQQCNITIDRDVEIADLSESLNAAKDTAEDGRDESLVSEAQEMDELQRNADAVSAAVKHASDMNLQIEFFEAGEEMWEKKALKESEDLADLTQLSNDSESSNDRVSVGEGADPEAYAAELNEKTNTSLLRCNPNNCPINSELLVPEVVKADEVSQAKCKIVCTNLESGLKLHELLNILLENDETQPTTAPTVLQQIAAYANQLLLLRKQFLLYHNYDACQTAISNLTADSVFANLLFKLVCVQELNGVKNYINNERTIDLLAKQLAHPVNYGLPRTGGPLFVPESVTSSLRTLIEDYIAVNGLASVRSYNLYVIASVVYDLRQSFQTVQLARLRSILKFIDSSSQFHSMCSQRYVPSEVKEEICSFKKELADVELLQKITTALASPTVDETSTTILSNGFICNELVDFVTSDSAVVDRTYLCRLTCSMWQLCQDAVLCRKQLDDWFIHKFQRYFSEESFSRRFSYAPSEIEATTDSRASAVANDSDEPIATMASLDSILDELRGLLQRIDQFHSSVLSHSQLTELLPEANYLPHQFALRWCEHANAVVGAKLNEIATMLSIIDHFVAVRREIVGNKISNEKSLVVNSCNYLSCGASLSTNSLITQHWSEPRSPFEFAHNDPSALERAVSNYAHLVESFGQQSHNLHSLVALFASHVDLASHLVRLRKLSSMSCWSSIRSHMLAMRLPPHVDVTYDSRLTVVLPVTSAGTSAGRRPYHAQLQRIFLGKTFVCTSACCGGRLSANVAEKSSIECALCLVADELTTYQIELVNRWAIKSLKKAIESGKITPLNLRKPVSHIEQLTAASDSNIPAIDIDLLQSVITSVSKFPILWMLSKQLLFTAKALIEIRKIFVSTDAKQNSGQNRFKVVISNDLFAMERSVPLDGVLGIVEQLLGDSQGPFMSKSQLPSRQSGDAGTAPQSGNPLANSSESTTEIENAVHTISFEELHFVRWFCREAIVFDHFKQVVKIGRIAFLLSDEGVDGFISPKLTISPGSHSSSYVITELEAACELANVAFTNCFEGPSKRCKLFQSCCKKLSSIRTLYKELDLLHVISQMTRILDLVRAMLAITSEVIEEISMYQEGGSDENPWVHIQSEVFSVAVYCCAKGLLSSVGGTAAIAATLLKRRSTCNIADVLHCSLGKELHLPISEISDSISQSENIFNWFRSVVSDTNDYHHLTESLKKCTLLAQAMVRLRRGINEGLYLPTAGEQGAAFRDWLASPDSLSVACSIVPQPSSLSFVVNEFSIAKQECDNVCAFAEISSAMLVVDVNTVGELVDVDSMFASVERLCDDVDIAVDFSKRPNMEAASNQTGALEQIVAKYALDNTIITFPSVHFMTDCASQLLQLRERLQNYKQQMIVPIYEDYQEAEFGCIKQERIDETERYLTEVLQWFQLHSMRCSRPVRHEYLRANLQYENVRLCYILACALRTGGLYPGHEVHRYAAVLRFPSDLMLMQGLVSELLDRAVAPKSDWASRTIPLSTAELRSAIAEAKSLLCQSKTLRELLKQAQLVLSLRLALRRFLQSHVQSSSLVSPTSLPTLGTFSSNSSSSISPKHGRLSSPTASALDSSALLGLKEAINGLSGCMNIVPPARHELFFAKTIRDCDIVTQELISGLCLFGVCCDESCNVDFLRSLPIKTLAHISQTGCLPKLTVELTPLEKAMELAKTVFNASHCADLSAIKSHIITSEIKLLYSTCVFMRSLRLAIKLNNQSAARTLLGRFDLTMLQRNVELSIPSAVVIDDALTLHSSVAAELLFYANCFKIMDQFAALKISVRSPKPICIHASARSYDTSDLSTAYDIIGVDSSGALSNKDTILGQIEQLSACLKYFSKAQLLAQPQLPLAPEDAKLQAASVEIQQVMNVAAEILTLRSLLCDKHWDAYFETATGHPRRFDLEQLARFGGLQKDEAVQLLREQLKHELIVEEVTECVQAVHILLSKRELHAKLLSLVGNVCSSGSIETAPLLLLACNRVHLLREGDLTLSWLMESIKSKYDSYVQCMRELRQCSHSFDRKFIEATLSRAKAFSADSVALRVLMESASARAGALRKLEMFLQCLDLAPSAHPSSRLRALSHLVQSAEQLSLGTHPTIQRARTVLQLPTQQQLAVLLIEGVGRGDVSHLAQISIELRNYFFESLPNRAKFSLANAPMLRESSQLLLPNLRQELKTSLSRLDAPLSDVAMTLGQHFIGGIVNGLFENSSFLLRNLVLVGLHSVHLRDEIYLQLVRQLLCMQASSISSHDSASAKNEEQEEQLEQVVDVLWRCIGCCLNYFNCSQLFENYFELFLIDSSESFRHRKTNIPQLCRQLLHESTARFGYNCDPSLFASQRKTSLKLASVLSNPNAIIPSTAILSAYATGDVSIHDVERWLINGSEFDRKAARYSLAFRSPSELKIESVTSDGLLNSVSSTHSEEGQAARHGSEQVVGSSAMTGNTLNLSQLLSSPPRGTPASWFHRFGKVLGMTTVSKTESCAQLMIVCSDLISSLTNPRSAAYAVMDPMDKDLLSFVIFGSRPRVSSVAAIRRQLYSDDRLYLEQNDCSSISYRDLRETIQSHRNLSYFEFIDQIVRAMSPTVAAVNNPPKELLSNIRRALLLVALRNYQKKKIQQSVDLSDVARAEAVKAFWKEIDSLYEAITADSASGRELEGDAEPVAKAKAFTAVALARVAFTSVISWRNRPSNDPMEAFRLVSQSHMSCDLYRDVVLVAAELYLASLRAEQ